MNRSGFLKSLVLGAGGLIVGEEAMERYARLTHVRKSFPSAPIGVSSYHWDSGIALPMENVSYLVAWGKEGPLFVPVH